jgi:hypothetical protein
VTVPLSAHLLSQTRRAKTKIKGNKEEKKREGEKKKKRPPSPFKPFEHTDTESRGREEEEKREGAKAATWFLSNCGMPPPVESPELSPIDDSLQITCQTK